MKKLGFGITVFFSGVNFLLFIYATWLVIQSNVWELLNPFIIFYIIYVLVQIPLFWISLVISIIGISIQLRKS